MKPTMRRLEHIFLLVLSLTAVCLSQNYKETGYGNNQYSTKTSYFWTYPKQTPPATDSLYTTIFHDQFCTAEHVNVLSRHGARYVSVDDMRAFSDLKNKLSGKFTNQSFDFINTWVNNYPENKAELVTLLGEEEMIYIGNTLGHELFYFLRNASLTDGLKAFQFSATRKTRTQESAHWFYEGLMRHIRGTFPPMTPDIKDDILRYYDHCAKYELYTSNMTELIKFEDGTEFQSMIKDIKDRLDTEVALTVADVKMIYRLCATELAIQNNADWCTILTDNDREILEYDNDIEDYITRLYGYSITQKMTCPLFENIFKEIDKATKGQSYKKGVFQFGHSDTIVDFLGAMGLFKDTEPILSNNYANMKNRKFRASKVDPFSTHLVFILYRCDGNYALRLRFNGEPLNIPACGNEMCWYNDVRQAYLHYIDHCQWQRECSLLVDPVTDDPLIG